MINILKKTIYPVLPKEFDKNEWYVIFVLILVCLAILFVYKRKVLLLTESFSIFLFNLQLATLGDYFLAMPPYDFYDTVDKPHGEIADVFLHYIIYPGSLLYLMHIFKAARPKSFWFILVCTLLLTGLEAVSVYIFDLIQYKKWNLMYSSVFYLLTMIVNVLFYKKLSVIIKRRFAEVTRDSI